MERTRERCWFEHCTNVTIPVGDVTVIRFHDKKIHDRPHVQQIKEELALFLEQGRKKIIFDFTGVEYTNEWFGVLIDFHKELSVAGGQMAMYNMHRNVFETFERMRLDKLFGIVPDEQTALLRLAEQAPPRPSPEDQLRKDCAQ